MTIFKSFFLGSVQGLTEFLPVSSSGHLVIIQNLLDLGSDIGFDVLLHFATVIAVLFYFRKDVVEIFRGLAGKSQTGLFYLKAVIIGSTPTAVIGFAFKGFFEAKFAQPKIAAAMLAVTGFVLFFASKYTHGKPGREIEKTRNVDFLLIGLLQGMAIMPGISRSGMTIAMALILGFKKETAFKYSMLLSVPAVLGAGLLEISKIEFNAVSVSGGAAALAAGIAALYVLSGMVVREKLHVFSYYLWAASALGLIFL